MNNGRPTNLLELAEQMAQERSAKTSGGGRMSDDPKTTRRKILETGAAEASKRLLDAFQKRQMAEVAAKAALVAEQLAREERDWWDRKVQLETEKLQKPSEEER